MMEPAASDLRSTTGAPAFSRRGFVAAALGGLGFAAAAGLTGCTDLLPRTTGSLQQTNLATIVDGKAAPKTATLAMVGDILVHRGVWQSGERSDGTRNYDHLFAQVADVLSTADIAIVNQETILGGESFGFSGFPLFNSPQEIGDAEVAVGVDVAAGATNHALDQGLAGIEAELAFWRDEHPEVACLGIADSQEVADEVHVLERNGIKIALLNYTATTNGIPVPSDAPWCVRQLEYDTVASDVARARELGADVVVVIPHSGTEYRLTPDDTQREWAQTFLDLGVDVMINCHPHVIEPAEVLEGSDGHRMVTFWSLGNFVSTQDAKERMIGGLAQVAFEKTDEGTSVTAWSLTPTVTHRASGTAMTTYLLPDYTEELARANAIRNLSDCGDFSLTWCQDFCEQVLGDGFDRESGVLTGVV